AGRGGVRLPPPGSAPRPDEALLLRAMLDAAPAPLLLLEPRGTIRALNRASRLLFGADDRLPAPASELVAALRDARVGERRRLRLAPRGGTARLYAFSLSEVAAVGGPLRVGALSDVQAEVHAAEARSLREVLQVLSHELGNSLTPIASLAESALHALEDAPSPGAADARAALEVIARRGEGLARFVAGYREAARLPPPRLRPVDLATLAADVAALARARPEAAGVRIVSSVEGPLMRTTDPDLVGQALSNLVRNAVDAATAAAAPEVTILAADTGQGAFVEVSDTGKGLPAEMRSRIFLPFVSTKPGGSGLGLHVARSAMRSLGGDVELLAEAPRTTFRLSL
ncbi:MAG: histidine kinase, partial [Caulobacteraceae bacterium]|nr:histidine kinase [Caulobacter sp.]